jgi:hypothetical protein
MIVEDFNNGADAMATMNFSVPEDVRDEFNRLFKGRNKSAILTELMRQAIRDEQLREQRRDAFREIESRRAERPPLTLRQITAARKAGRQK